MSIKPVNSELNICQCERCGFQWASRGIPKSCANNGQNGPPACRSRYWNKLRCSKLPQDQQTQRKG